MDPVSAILAALIAGATAAASETASQAVKDAYHGLKALLVKGYKFASTSLLEKNPHNAGFQEAVRHELKESVEVSSDKTVLEATKALQEALRAEPSQQLAAWGVDIKVIDAAHDVVVQRITGSGGGLRADRVSAGGSVVISDVSGGEPSSGKS